MLVICTAFGGKPLTTRTVSILSLKGSTPVTSRDDWLTLANDLLEAGRQILGASTIKITEKGAADTKVLAATLLIRSISNFRGIITLVNAGMVVEARVLVRTCLENTLWLGRLAKEGDAFAQKMLEDEIKHREALGQGIFSRKAAREGLTEDSGAKLRKALKEHRAQFPDAKTLNAKGVADKIGPAGDAHLFYGVLSADAAHPSLSALNRYIASWDEDGAKVRGLDATLTPDESEVVETLGWACMSFLGAEVGAVEIIGAPIDLTPLAERYTALTKRLPE